MGSKALPTHLRAPESEAFGGKHHGKTQSHMVSSFQAVKSRILES